MHDWRGSQSPYQSATPPPLYEWNSSKKTAYSLLCLPFEEVGTFWFTFVRSVCPLSLCLCVLSVYRAGGQTRDVDPMLG